MLKRLLLSLAFSTGILSPSFGAGTIPFSLSQQLDSLGKPLIGCKFYTIVAGTTSTPQSAYQDSALTIALPNPQTCDSAGRLPQMFLADGSIKIRLTNSGGVTQVVADNVQVIGNSSGGGGGSPVDPTTVLQTGWMQPVYGTGVVSGFVRANGRTIGSATSGGTERANSDCQALFVYLWGADANLTVSTGRGASAAADWSANKTITLPDMRGRVIAGLDDMGNSAASHLTSTYFGSATTTLGNATAVDHVAYAVAQANLPNITLTSNAQSATVFGNLAAGGIAAGGVTYQNGMAASGGGGTSSSTIAVGSQTIPLGGSGTALQIGNVQPTMLMTYYLKL